MSDVKSEFKLPALPTAYSKENWCELVFTAKGRWPTCTAKYKTPDKYNPEGRIIGTQRFRRWPDTQWYENDPAKEPTYEFQSKKYVKPIFNCKWPTQAQIEAAFQVWIGRRMLLETSADRERDEAGSQANPG